MLSISDLISNVFDFFVIEDSSVSVFDTESSMYSSSTSSEVSSSLRSCSLSSFTSSTVFDLSVLFLLGGLLASSVEGSCFEGLSLASEPVLLSSGIVPPSLIIVCSSSFIRFSLRFMSFSACSSKYFSSATDISLLILGLF